MSNTEIVEFKVPDDCMVPTLMPGDSALIDRARRKLVDGAVYALRMERGSVLRRISFLSPWLIRVTCDNSLYPAHEVSVKELKIIGRVIFSSRILA
jgi:phage repressor protein C with HTH and peptisase S24 domain